MGDCRPHDISASVPVGETSVNVGQYTAVRSRVQPRSSSAAAGSSSHQVHAGWAASSEAGRSSPGGPSTQARTISALPVPVTHTHTAGAPDRGHAQRHAPGGEPVGVPVRRVEVARGAGDGLGRQVYLPGRRVVRRPGLVHADVAVDAQSENHQVEAGGQRLVDSCAHRIEVGGIHVELAERVRRQIDAVDELAPQRDRATATVIGGQPAELVEQEHGGVAPGNVAGLCRPHDGRRRREPAWSPSAGTNEGRADAAAPG